MVKAIYFDMDGTIADLYGVDGWLDSLLNGHTKPYRLARPLVDMRRLGKVLNNLQAAGYTIGVVSWLSKSATADYNERVEQAKRKWLKAHLGAVEWDEINIVPYGTPKATVVAEPMGLLFDDEQPNRDNWTGIAYDVNEILEILEGLQ